MKQAPAAFRSRVAPDVATLLEANGPDFVRTAYLTVLCRKPDPSGRESAEEFMRRGGRKIDLIWSLARSEEGQKLAVEVAGLASALRRRAIGRMPLVGLLMRPLLGIEPVGAVHRHERAIAFAAAKLHEMIAIRLHRLESQLEAKACGADSRAEYCIGPGSSQNIVRVREIMKSLRARLT